MPNELDAVAMEPTGETIRDRLLVKLRSNHGRCALYMTQEECAMAIAALASAKPAQAGAGRYFDAMREAIARQEAERRAESAEARVLSLETRLATMGEALKTLLTATDNMYRGDETGGIKLIDVLDLTDARNAARAILSTEASHHG